VLVFSLKYTRIMYCDSVAWKKKDIQSRSTNQAKIVGRLLSAYMFPKIPDDSWEFVELAKQDRFQYTDHLDMDDCGYHIMNFMSAALEDRHVINDKKTFASWKNNFFTSYNEVNPKGISCVSEGLLCQHLS
jgi:hypothetical protein